MLIIYNHIMILYGKKSLLDNLKNSDKIKYVELLNNVEIINILKKNNIEYKIKEKSFFAKFDKNLNHQYIVIHMEENKSNTLEDFLKNKKDESIVLVLDNIKDPFNFGSIIRTAECYGVDCIIYKKDNQVQINDYVIKSSQGAIYNINLIKVININSTLEELKKNGYWIYATTLNEKSVEAHTITYDKKTCLILGSEENGISKSVIDNSDFCVKIKMYGNTQSLNVGVSCGIMLDIIKNNVK